VVDEPVTVVVSQKGWVRARKGHEVDPAAAFKAGDGLYGTFACRSVDTLLVFGSNGRVYSVAVAMLPGARGDGQPITTLIELESGTQLLHYTVPDGVYLPATHVACVSASRRVLTFEITELKPMAGGGRGLMLMDLDNKDSLAGAAAYTRSVRITGTFRDKEREEVLEIRTLNNARAARGRKGKDGSFVFKPVSVERVE
jgi:topoisomerase-4 subunit A